MIPQAAPFLRIERYRSEIDRAIAGVLSSSHYILGPAVEAFEADFAAYIGVKHCVGVDSGTNALALALRGLGIGPGDEVITTALTFSGTAQAILHCGAQPRFVDVDPASRCIDPEAVAAAISERTAAIVPVHLFGHAADMPRLMQIAAGHGIAILEDCAQAHGASIDGRKLGSFGRASAFSFYPTKNLGGVGDSGAILTNDDQLAAELQSLRRYGMRAGHAISSTMGFNARMDELQAAILSVLLKHLDAGNAERRALADEYRSELAGLDLLLPPDDPGDVYHQFAIVHQNRDRLAHRLLEETGVGTAIHYHPTLNHHPAFRDAISDKLSHSEWLSAGLLSLPIQPEVATGRIGAIARNIAKVIE